MKAQEADHIGIPLLDGTHCVAQLAHLRDRHGLLLLTMRRARPGDATFPIPAKDVQSLLTVDLAAVPEGHWPVLGYEAVPTRFRQARAASDPAAATDPAIVEALANALQGLYPWDGFPDPDFFTKLLRFPDRRPSRARLAAQMPDPD